MQGALVSLDSNALGQSNNFHDSNPLAVALPSALPFQNTGILPARPNLPEDPIVPHNGFLNVEEGEKAFMHLLRKAGVDANWTWDQTMRAIITDPLYKALNSLAEKKATWQKVRPRLVIGCLAYIIIVHGKPKGQGARRT